MRSTLVEYTRSMSILQVHTTAAMDTNKIT